MIEWKVTLKTESEKEVKELFELRNKFHEVLFTPISDTAAPKRTWSRKKKAVPAQDQLNTLKGVNPNGQA